MKLVLVSSVDGVDRRDDRVQTTKKHIYPGNARVNLYDFILWSPPLNYPMLA